MELPFHPFSQKLIDVLREDYIKPVTIWLLGKDKNRILAQSSNSNWESALSLIFLSEVEKILSESNENVRIKGNIHKKNVEVTKWLLSTKSKDGECCYWDKVTWDTSVVIQALITSLNNYENEFPENVIENILSSIFDGTRWLYKRFTKWESEVKYPFGPSDVSQIVIALVMIAKYQPKIYKEVCRYFGYDEMSLDIISDIVEYLIYVKTEISLHISEKNQEDETINSCCWDDFFNTAEVVYGLAYFYQFCQEIRNSITNYKVDGYKNLLKNIESTLIKSCAYFEYEQIDGMWGSHVDTVRGLHAYIYIQRVIPERIKPSKDPLIIPEIHTIFKALRWICDEKQVFSDGSMLHTMFLTIFYSLALLEVYKSWEPVNKTIAELYDDVLWYSPVRTTPERVKRLSAELKNKETEDELIRVNNECKILNDKIVSLQINNRKIIMLILITLLSFPLFLLSSSIFTVAQIDFSLIAREYFWEYLAIFITIYLAVITFIITNKGVIKK